MLLLTLRETYTLIRLSSFQNLRRKGGQRSCYATTSSICSRLLTTTPWVKKTRHQTLGHNFTNYCARTSFWKPSGFNNYIHLPSHMSTCTCHPSDVFTVYVWQIRAIVALQCGPLCSLYNNSNNAFPQKIAKTFLYARHRALFRDSYSLQFFINNCL